ncbi:hypothetical protein FRC11_009054, partial [Ceratobasidium sp. 423]
FKTLKSLVDEMDDPEPPQGFLPRIPGSPREGIPPANTCNQYLLRDWMVDPAVLEEHPEWHKRRLVISDDEPIETPPPTQSNKRKNELKAHQNSSTLPPDAKKARLDLSAAREKLKDTLAGETFEGLGLALEDEGGPGPSQNALEEEEDDLYD